MTRLYLNEEISLEISCLEDELREEIYQAYKAREAHLIDTVQGNLKTPACLILAYFRGKKLWGLVFTASVPAPPHCVIGYLSELDLLWCGYGLNLYCLQFSSGDVLWHHETEYPIQNLFAATEDSSLYLVSELAIEKLRLDGNCVWEHWHKEPIETVLLTQSDLEIRDLEGGKYLLDRKSGKSFP